MKPKRAKPFEKEAYKLYLKVIMAKYGSEDEIIRRALVRAAAAKRPREKRGWAVKGDDGKLKRLWLTGQVVIYGKKFYAMGKKAVRVRYWEPEVIA